jgi:hypothetical protein
MATKVGVPKIEVSMDRVVICNQIVTRPASISPSQWLQFWRKVTGEES